MSVGYEYYCAFFDFLTLKELSTERPFIVYTVRLNQCICFKGVLTSKFGSKAFLLWKINSALVTTKDENLWISSRLMWFDGPRTPERSNNYFIQQKKKAVWKELHPNSQILFLNVCLHLKGYML